jgi:hypothetical protein
MATTLDSRPSATTLDVEELVKRAWDGQVRVPHFQRDFRWNWEDVRRLFDSIVKGYPIGSFLLWTRKAPKAVLQLGALRINAPRLDNAWWVVDGQQRLTSLANALHPEGARQARFALSYDLDSEEFVRTPAIESPMIIPLPTLFDLQQILKWFSRYPAIADHLDRATAITRKIRQFEVPAYLVSEEDPRILQDIFDRMNNYGKRLSRAEIFAALNAGDESQGEGSLTFEIIADQIDFDLAFGKIDSDTVLSAILARRGPDVRRNIRTEFSKHGDEGRDAAFEAGAEALRRAVEFLQQEAGVPHRTMLAYRYLLVVLTRVFALYPSLDLRSTRLLRRWYWQAAMVGPESFRGSTPNAASALCAKVVPGNLNVSIQGLLSAIKRGTRTALDLARFSTGDASAKMLLCALWAEKPRNPVSGEVYSKADLAEALVDETTAREAVKYLISPRGSAVPKNRRRGVANRAIMPKLDVDQKEIVFFLAQPSLGLPDDAWRAVIDSHCITVEMASFLIDGDFARFLDARHASLEFRVNRFLDSVCEWDFEDTPPLAALTLDDEDSD